MDEMMRVLIVHSQGIRWQLKYLNYARDLNLLISEWLPLVVGIIKLSGTFLHGLSDPIKDELAAWELPFKLQWLIDQATGIFDG